MMRIATSFALALALLAAGPSDAQDAAPAIMIGGQVQHPGAITLADLQKLPPVTVAIAFATDKGGESANYKGALLSTIVSNAAPIDGPGKNAGFRHTIVVTGRDGYAATLSEGEIDPKLEGKMVVLAYEKDGNPVKEGIRLVVPGDHMGARAVRDVVKIEVQ